MTTTSTAPRAPETTRPAGDSPPPAGDAPPPRRRRRTPVWASYRVLKATMAVTGTIMALFVVVHMIGNLKVLMGPEAFNGYAAWLRRVAYPLLPHEGLLWIMRLALGACIVLHVSAGIMLWRRGRGARGAFRRRSLPARTIGARSMLATGVLIGVFVLVHLLDLTIGRLVAPESFVAPTTSNGELQVSAYHNLVASLSRPGMAVFYSLVMLALSLHLAQGLWNVVIDLGGTGPRLRKLCRVLAIAVALAIAVVNGLLPVLICTGVIG